MVKHAHSQWFNVLSELGVVGLVLFVAAVRPVRGRDGGQPVRRAAVTRCTRCSSRCRPGVIAFVVHISWDWDWDMAAVGTLAFVFIAVCASYRSTTRADERSRRRAARR